MNTWLGLAILTAAAFVPASGRCDPPAADASPQARTGTQVQTAQHVKYKAGKEVDFEQLLIEGRIRRPEISVVTADSGKGTDGLLRLRENFLDRMAVDVGEEVK